VPIGLDLREYRSEKAIRPKGWKLDEAAKGRWRIALAGLAASSIFLECRHNWNIAATKLLTVLMSSWFGKGTGHVSSETSISSRSVSAPWRRKNPSMEPGDQHILWPGAEVLLALALGARAYDQRRNVGWHRLARVEVCLTVGTRRSSEATLRAPTCRFQPAQLTCSTQLLNSKDAEFLQDKFGHYAPTRTEPPAVDLLQQVKREALYSLPAR
jgi:hypothetical protein